MTRFTRTLLATTALASGLALASAASAASLVGLVDGSKLVLIDPDSRAVTGTVDITGASDLVGIDVRPADSMLYGLASDGTLYTIDPQSGAATEKSTLSETLSTGTTFTVDFNPAADRLRVMSADGTSLRINVDDGDTTVDGSHSYASGDATSGNPNVVAGAYTNSVNGTKPESTQLFNIDGTAGTLVLQDPPNDGVLNTVGALGVEVSGPVAFNIVTTEAGNIGWLAAGGMLYSVNLDTAETAPAGAIEGVEGTLIDIAWWE